MSGHGGLGISVGGPQALAMGLGLGAGGLHNGAQDLSLPKREPGLRNGGDEDDDLSPNSLTCGPFSIHKSKAESRKSIPQFHIFIFVYILIYFKGIKTLENNFT